MIYSDDTNPENILLNALKQLELRLDPWTGGAVQVVDVLTINRFIKDVVLAYWKAKANA